MVNDLKRLGRNIDAVIWFYAVTDFKPLLNNSEIRMHDSSRTPAIVLNFLLASAASFCVAIAAGIALILTAIYFDGHSLPRASVPNSVILDNVNIVPISQPGILPRRKIVIEGGRIVAIESAGPPLPEGSEVIDMKSLYLMPGLVDMHVHIDDREQLRLSLSYGVTAVRNMDGMPFHLRWRKELNAGDWLGSRLYSASPIINGEEYSSLFDIVVQSEDQAERLYKQLSEEGWDYIKVYSGLGLVEFNMLIEASQESPLPIVGHVPYAVVRADYARTGDMLTVEHVEEIFQGPLGHKFDQRLLTDAIGTLAQAHATVCPTLSTFENLTMLSVEKEKYLRQLSTSHMTPFGEFFQRKTDIERWLNASSERGKYNIRELQFLKGIVKQLDERDVALVLGTDSGTNFVQAGPSLIQEIRLMLEAGLSPHSVLKSATLNAAIALNIEHDYGSIEVGKMADFVVTQMNPLEEPSTLAEPKGVFVQGNFLDGDALADLRSGQDRVAGWWISVSRYFEAMWMRFTMY